MLPNKVFRPQPAKGRPGITVDGGGGRPSAPCEVDITDHYAKWDNMESTIGPLTLTGYTFRAELSSWLMLLNH